MNIIKSIPFILLAVGTLGLLAVELFVALESRTLTLSFAGLNALGLLGAFLALKKGN